MRSDFNRLLKKQVLAVILISSIAFEGWSQIPSYPPPPDLPPPATPVPTMAPAVAPIAAPLVTPPSSSSTAEKDNGGLPSTAAGLSSMEALDDKVALHAGDRISFRVIEDQDEAIPRIVTDTGEVDFPYVGRIKVDGRTCKSVAFDLKKLLEVDYYKRATVIVGLDSIQVLPTPIAKEEHKLAWIVGQVRSVGPVEILPDEPITVSQVILKAGGFGDFADQRKVKLIHRGPASSAPSANVSNSENGEVIDVKSVFDGKSTIDPKVEPNDLIVVPKRAVNF